MKASHKHRCTPHGLDKLKLYIRDHIRPHTIYIICVIVNPKKTVYSVAPWPQAKVKKWEEDGRPDPCGEDMLRYTAILKMSHDAAVKGVSPAEGGTVD